MDAIPHEDYNSKYLNITKGGFNEPPPDIMGDDVGNWQFKFLKDQGLTTESLFLDIDCGYLRGGVHFIEYLEQGNYYGMDISEDALKQAKIILEMFELSSNNPTLFQNENLRFNDAELENIEFDYILAQSVFTHLPPEYIEECLSNVSKVLHRDGVFFATYWESENQKIIEHLDPSNFDYPLEFFKDFESHYDLNIQKVPVDRPGRWNHEMLEVTLESNG